MLSVTYRHSMLSVFMLNVVMLNVVMLSVVMMRGVMLRVLMLNVIMLSVIRLSNICKQDQELIIRINRLGSGLANIKQALNALPVKNTLAYFCCSVGDE
jgi:hypothetical protein